VEKNKGILRGVLKEKSLVKDYERDGEVFYSGTLLVERLSGVYDEVPIVVPGKYKYYINPEVELSIEGSFRSRNVMVNERSTLCLYFFVENVADGVLNLNNNIELEGYLCKNPVYRVTPFNREICDLLIAVNRPSLKSDYIPCLLWGRNAKWAKNLKVGEKVSLTGRIQSRKYTKSGDLEQFSRTAYEVSVNRIHLTSENNL
jgi:primosomal replication protein N